ncbi:DUF5058 family protein [Aerococcus kribbianus]|uniref:DUF5058 family protein n=1 Tax=Aerococcus kribbianus TaxID=2999064 RepID=A0A9X3FPV3_9LACT|nr:MULTISPECIES: DUF5058 family protein [unclassified Aerococcus]MCZ0717376.1 DUF5058 family protein [Aerococcus sp. YH-aer221]MCZ0725664.1 DUF5058 family protein [Aerococcus sp. YH-aer222]
MDYKVLANSTVLFILIALCITIVAAQAILFIRMAWKHGKELGIETSDMKKTVTNSFLLTIMPSLPIIVMMFALSVPLGKYFPWLRLSIVGSASYEGMAANIAAQASGLTDISDPNMTADIFVVVMLVMTIGIIWGIMFNIFILPKLDKKAKSAQQNAKSGNLMGYLSGFLFIAMLATLSTPYAANINNVQSIVAFVTAGITVLILDKIAEVTEKSLISDFSLPVALIVGMAAVIIQTNVL